MNVIPIPCTRRNTVGSLEDEDFDAAFEQVCGSRKPARPVPSTIAASYVGVMRSNPSS